MQSQDLQHFKAKLEEELKRVEKELSTVGTKNPDNPSDWEAKPDEMDIDMADPVDSGDPLESLENNAGIEAQLEIQLNEIRRALKKIDNGTYGVCEKSGKQIPHERLEANPAARTLIEYADEIEATETGEEA